MNDRPGIHVLHLPRWYPHEGDPMLGLFVKNQLQALPDGVRSTVVFAWPEKGLKAVRRTETVSGSIREIHLALPTGVLGFINFLQLVRLLFRESLRIHREDPFHLVHAHVLTRVGFAAGMVARRCGVPYIVSEHWSRYFPENLLYEGNLRKVYTGRVLREAKALICVSEPLKEAMAVQGLTHPHTSIVANVVDTARFAAHTVPKPDGKMRLLHISCFEDKSKNISGLLKAVAQLKSKGTDFTLTLVGEGPDKAEMMALAQALKLGVEVRFTGLLTPAEVAKLLPSAHYLVQSSNYETFSTVVAEAWACGVPVVSTRVGFFGSVFHDGLGIVVASGSPDHLCQALEEANRRKGTFDSSILRKQATDHCSPAAVGAALVDIYRKVLEAKAHNNMER